MMSKASNPDAMALKMTGISSEVTQNNEMSVA